jgi:hypothetical protein
LVYAKDPAFWFITEDQKPTIFWGDRC